MKVARLGFILLALSLVFYLGAIKGSFNVMRTAIRYPTTTYWIYLSPVKGYVNLTLGVFPGGPGRGVVVSRGSVWVEIYDPYGQLLVNTSLNLPYSISLQPDVRGLYKLVLYNVSPSNSSIPILIEARGIEFDKLLAAEVSLLMGAMMVLLQPILTAISRRLHHAKMTTTNKEE